MGRRRGRRGRDVLWQLGPIKTKRGSERIFGSRSSEALCGEGCVLVVALVLELPPSLLEGVNVKAQPFIFIGRRILHRLTIFPRDKARAPRARAKSP
eukprot:7422990-Pyramimonas_sp.AAC.1